MSNDREMNSAAFCFSILFAAGTVGTAIPAFVLPNLFLAGVSFLCATGAFVTIRSSGVFPCCHASDNDNDNAEIPLINGNASNAQITIAQ